jgi:MFS family permease
MSAVVQDVIRTRIPARLDRLPWSRFHWRIVIGLGTVWILDGLEVTIVGSIASRLTEKGSGISIDTSQIGQAAAIYVAGACIGALIFGQMTDRFGRKNLFMITLGVYIAATVATAFAPTALYFFVCRFFTGMGIGGEYAAINSAIDELIPARARGQTDLAINGSYWVGSAAGSALAVVLLNTSIFAADVGWRLSFGLGALLGLGILVVRRHVPESPRWLFIHGREEEAERIVDSIETEIREETDQELAEPRQEIAVRQRKAIPFREIARVAFEKYPRRAWLGIALFVGQAFIYNAITFDLGTILSTYFKVASGDVPYFIVIFAFGNFLGPLLLGRLFDTIGRKPMITGTYLMSAVGGAVLAILVMDGSLTKWSFIALVGVTFFFASAGASSAYLTVSEIFPMETRALAIAFFYALGTAIGGITGPLVFSKLISSGDVDQLAIGFFIGAAVMAVGAIAEIFLGVRAEGESLEDIAKPLTAEEAEGKPLAGAEDELPEGVQAPAATEVSDARREALRCRERAEEERARAAEHRAEAHELQPAADAGDERAASRLRSEEVLAEIADLRAQGFDERANAGDERAQAEDAEGDADRNAALERAAAADERARAFDERVAALAAEHDHEAEAHEALAEAAGERARAREQRAQAEKARGEADANDGPRAEQAAARADMHEAWAAMHRERANAQAARAAKDGELQTRHERIAADHEQRALAAEQRVHAAEHRVAASEIGGEAEAVERTQQELEEAERREREAREREERIRARIERRRARETHGARRFRLGPGSGSAFYSPGMMGTASRWSDAADEDLDREIDVISRALAERGATERDELAQLVGARYWGPGRFRSALREAVEEGRAQRVSRTTYAPAEGAAQGSAR